MYRYLIRSITAAMLAALLLLSGASRAMAFDLEKLSSEGLIRGDLSTWAQNPESFPENSEVSVNGWAPLSSMGCSYYATFFMLVKMGLKDRLRDTAWEFALECSERGLNRSGTGYFDPRSIDELTEGRVLYREKGNYENYYDGQAAIGECENTGEVIDLLRTLTEDKGYFCVVCCVGEVTTRTGDEYWSEGHYIFIDKVLEDDMIIGDPGYPGTRWSENWGAHGSSIVKIYCYKRVDGEGKQIYPEQMQSMYINRSPDDD